MQLPHRPVSARWVALTRFFCEQCLHTRMTGIKYLRIANKSSSSQAIPDSCSIELSGAAAIADGELVVWVGRKELGDKAEPLCKGLRGKQRILAFA